MLLLLAAAGCATGPLHSGTVHGHVVARTDRKEIVGLAQESSFVVAGPGMFWWEPSGVRFVSGWTPRMYDVKLKDGRVLQAFSGTEFELGACVVLRHSTDLSKIAPPFHYVPGKLEESNEC